MDEENNQPQVEVTYQHRVGQKIRCDVCPRECLLDEGDIGTCGGRKVVNGHLFATNYAEICALHLDPIEKKPLYHFFPGSEILSVGPNGCNLTCPWCQNWRISQDRHPTRVILPHELAEMVDALDGIGVAYTYAEPLIWFEYVRDAGRIFHERGLVNVIITNGYVSVEPLKEVLEVADAFNVDLKTTEAQVLKHYCGARLQDVQRNIKMMFDAGKHLELTHLIVTDINDDLNKIEELVKWIASVDRKIPLHLSRYFPAHLYKRHETALKFMDDAFQLARSYLDYIYLGNTHNGSGQDSHCPKCGHTLVKRMGYNTEIVGLNGNRCAQCNTDVNFRVDAALIGDICNAGHN